MGPVKPWTKEEWENRSPHPDWKEKFDERTAATIDRLEFYQEREADICKAVGGISDGGKYRNDIIEHLQMLVKKAGPLVELTNQGVKALKTQEGLPIERTVEDLIFNLSQVRSDFLIVGNGVGNISLIDPETHDVAGFVNVRTAEVTIYGKDTTHG